MESERGSEAGREGWVENAIRGEEERRIGVWMERKGRKGEDKESDGSIWHAYLSPLLICLLIYLLV